MKILDLIEQLKKAEKKHGNIAVYVADLGPEDVYEAQSLIFRDWINEPKYIEISCSKYIK